ncbi:hypothetical protein Tco_1155976 [Tanacetum coccineum]
MLWIEHIIEAFSSNIPHEFVEKKLLEGSAANPFAGGNEPEETEKCIRIMWQVGHLKLGSVTTGKLLIMDKVSQHEGLVDLSWLPRKKPKSFDRKLINVFNCLETKQRDGKYKHTVDLPKTTFGIRANYSVREPELQKLWDENHVFKNVAENITGSDKTHHSWYQ